MKLRRFFKAIAFVLILLLLVNGITLVLQPTYIQGRWETSSSMLTFYEEEPNSIEVIAIGSSVCVAGIDPYKMYQEQGISAYNMAIISEPMIGTYYWLKECYKTQSPKLVMIEIQIAARKNEKKEEKFRKCYDYMNFGLNKLEFAYQYCKTNEDAQLWEYLFPLAKFHTRWSGLTEEDIDFTLGDNEAAARGFNALVNQSGISYEGMDMSSDELPKKYSEVDYAYLEKIIDLCRENGSKVLLFKTPDSTWPVEKHNLISLMAEKKEAEFIDFNEPEIYKKLQLNYASDANDTQHLNLYGAEKLTTYLGKYIAETYELTDFRNTAIGKSIEDGLGAYEEYMLVVEEMMGNEK